VAHGFGLTIPIFSYLGWLNNYEMNKNGLEELNE
jgi:hypothetical protein